MTQTTAITRILDAAERRLRRFGYHGFRLEEVAHDAGVKPAVLQQHFATKEALVVELVERYIEEFMAAVADAPPGLVRITAYQDAFRATMEDWGRMCLCGLLGAESKGLPEEVARVTRRFFVRTFEHLAEGLEGDVVDPNQTAMATMALLEGATVLARTLGSITAFDAATAILTDPRNLGGEMVTPDPNPTPPPPVATPLRGRW
ncbi:MAG: TetR/AcrR family transcriptional regulator [Candidatus Competibacterales bacterium]